MNELETIKKIRERVRANNGPDRKRLPLFHFLGKLSSKELQNLKEDISELIHSKSEGYNDLKTEIYQVSMAVSEAYDYFPEDYRQYLFQTTEQKDNSVVPKEWEMSEYLDDRRQFETYIRKFASPHFRARLAVVPSEDTIDWHIDSNTSYACRSMIMVQGSQKFMIRKKGKVYEQIMHPGEAWFCNTGYSHKVEVSGNESRLSVLFSCHYNAIEHLVPCLT